MRIQKLSNRANHIMTSDTTTQSQMSERLVVGLKNLLSTVNKLCRKDKRNGHETDLKSIIYEALSSWKGRMILGHRPTE
jgi:hypothetical protein